MNALRDPRHKLLGLATPVVLVGAVLAFVVSDYRLFQLTTVAIYAIAILGLALVTGINGQISLGHGAFYAVGAYVTAILMSLYDVPYWATLPVSAVVCAAIGFSGRPAGATLRRAVSGADHLRAGGRHPCNCSNTSCLQGWTGGVQGLVVDKPDPPFGLPINRRISGSICSRSRSPRCCSCSSANLARGRIGRAMRAVRDNALAAEATGIDVALFKTRTFAVSAMITGVARVARRDRGRLRLAGQLHRVPVHHPVHRAGGGRGGDDWRGGSSARCSSRSCRTWPNRCPRRRRASSTGVVLIAFMFLLPSGVAGGLGQALRRTRRKLAQR